MSIGDRSKWTADDRRDYMDGWHEASGLGFKSRRDKRREVVREVPGRREKHVIGTAVELMAMGRADREKHRAETGI